MFRRQRRAHDADPPAPQGERERFTYIEQGTVVTGTLEATGRLRVHGAIRGNVDVDGLVEVAPDGVIEGEYVKAEALVILGRVTANVRVTGKVEVWRDAHLEGDVWASALDIEEGATFRGRSDMPQRADAPRLDAPVGAIEAVAGAPAAGAPSVADAVPAFAPVVADAAPAVPTGDDRAPATPGIHVVPATSGSGAGSGIHAVAVGTPGEPGAALAADVGANGTPRPAERSRAPDAASSASQPAEREDMQSRT